MAKSKTKRKPAKKRTGRKAPATPKVVHHEIIEMDLADLTPADYNPRVIKKPAFEGLGASLDRFGMLQPIVWNKRSSTIVGGHKRIEALEQRGVERTQVVVVDLSPTEERAANLTLNNPAIAGEFDSSLQEVLDSVKLELPEDVFVGLRLDELDMTPPEELNEGTTPDPPKKPKTKLGDIITLGRHRLICGDSTDAETVARLLDGAKPGIMVTDPPYGVEYDPEWRERDGLGADRLGKVANDNRSDWREAYDRFPGDVAYVWHASLFIAEVALSIEASGMLRRSLIIWDKGTLLISRGHYHWQHEPCWYSVRKGKTARWCGDRKQSTVWSIARRGADGEDQTEHATQKPIECMARPLRNHDFSECYDPFLGSGTTLIAAEQLGKTCFGAELSEAYVDVIVGRYLSLFPDHEVTRERKGKVRPWR